MRATATTLEVVADVAYSATITGPGRFDLGPFTVDISITGDDDRTEIGWAVANRSDAAETLRAVRLHFTLIDASSPLRIFSNGYQSWSRAATMTLGLDDDPSRASNSIRSARDAYFADPDVSQPGELRSELVTLLADGRGDHLVVGFAGGWTHDGTIRLRDTPRGPVMIVEAFLGGAVLPAGSERQLHSVLVERTDSATSGLDTWTQWLRAGLAATPAGLPTTLSTDRWPYQLGWCSWYQYFHQITEQTFRENLSGAADWPFDLFQLDDGYQTAVGDWLTTNDKFPSTLDVLADDIHRSGHTPGIWLAPFLASPDSAVATEHPNWLTQDPSGDGPLGAWLNPEWGGLVMGIDTTNPAVQEHLAATAASLVEAGYEYLKLDFTFAPGLEGSYHDPSLTPAERVRAGYDAIRRGAGSETFILGCGAPLGACIGAVDAMRIGADVAPYWHLAGPSLPGLEDTAPATAHALRNTFTRSFMHRRLWLNDPDCILLRPTDTRLEPHQIRTWAHAVAASGGMALVSDDLTRLGTQERSLLDEVVTIGREVDTSGTPPVCDGLLRPAGPKALRSSAATLELTSEDGRSVLRLP